MVYTIVHQMNRSMENDLGYFPESFIYNRFLSGRNLDFILVRIPWRVLSKKGKHFLPLIDP